MPSQLANYWLITSYLARSHVSLPKKKIDKILLVSYSALVGA